jgi:pimeloyl-ACP methyl ester carboxylesterase
MKNIVFIHGMFMNPKSWAEWIKYFEAKGFKCHAPSYPFHDGEPRNLRNNIPEGLGKLTLEEVLESIKKQIQLLDSKPILIGHSMGGSITQLLVHQDLAEAGICIDSAPVGGLLSFKWSFLKSNLPVLNPLKGDKPYLMPLEHFHYTFCNTMTLDETEKAYKAFLVPESRNIARSAAGKAGQLDFSKPHAPLLFIAGEKDNIVPHSLNEKNKKSYTHRQSITDYKLFPNRSHYICGQKGWEEIAAYVDNWLKRIA